MTGVQFTCRDCGNMIQPSDRVRLFLLPDKSVRCDIPCPSCYQLTTRFLQPGHVMLLMQIGIYVEPVPAEVFEPHDGPPITEADIAAFVEQLQNV